METGSLVNEAGRLGKDLRDKEKRFQEEGGDLFLRRRELESEMAELVRRKAATEDHLRELAAGPLPLLMVDHLLGEVEAQARKESEIRHNLLLVEAMTERDQSILQWLEAEKLGAPVLKRVDKKLSTDRKARAASANEPLLLDANAHFTAHVSHLRSRVLPEAVESSRQLMRSIGDLSERIARLEAELGRVPDEDRIASFQKELDSARKAHLEKMAELNALKIRAEILGRQRTEAEARLDRFGDRVADPPVPPGSHHSVLNYSSAA